MGLYSNIWKLPSSCETLPWLQEQIFYGLRLVPYQAVPYRGRYLEAERHALLSVLLLPPTRMHLPCRPIKRHHIFTLENAPEADLELTLLYILKNNYTFDKLSVHSTWKKSKIKIFHLLKLGKCFLQIKSFTQWKTFERLRLLLRITS